MNPTQHDAASTASHPQQPYAENVERSHAIPRERAASPASSIASLPYRRANASISNLFASTSSLPGSGRSSGSNTPTALASSVFSPGGGTANGAFSPSTFVAPTQGRADEPRNLILKAFVPHVGVLASPDTEDILLEKGFKGGFLELLRPFGEKIGGKVTIRNSVGASTTWDDYGIRFTGIKDGLGFPPRRISQEFKNANARLSGTKESPTFGPSKLGGDVAVIEELVDRHLQWAELVGPSATSVDYMNHQAMDENATPKVGAKPCGESLSPFYTLYFRRLLSGLPMTPHETFSHPVACVIVISSRNPNPIGELKELYQSTNSGDDRLPQWVNNEYLRYYVLVHDEDRDDIAKSTSLYEQMRRSFGLHCHLLRLRSTQCLPSDDDSVRLPTCEWLSAGEELAEIQYRETADDDEDHTPYLFESDVTAIRTLIRELVAQSIIPSMERSCAQWNDQVAARRRGIGGRLMSLSKRFAFGSGSRNSSSPVQNANSNYDSLQGFYRPDAPEAVMRKLADYAFMLRDFKLAHSTYDLLRSDFDNDKAWKHYAGANEMAAVSALLSAQAITSKFRSETLDRMLESATHSYIHRSMTPYYALRSLMMSLELLKLRGSSAVDDAARWGSRALEAGLVGDVGQALLKERIGVCYASRQGIGSMAWGRRRRKAGLWTVLAADNFMRLGKTVQAEKCLSEAKRLYGLDDEKMVGNLAFGGMGELLSQLGEAIVAARLAAKGQNDEDQLDQDFFEAEKDTIVEVVSESLDGRAHRRSIVGAVVPGLDPLGVMTEPLSPVRLRAKSASQTDDGFS
ncbi:uncharacterized protein PV09_07956 [Verruconis gallopava]|uniref:Uncharacterized protein n=1 Tax=Verruconis gallopava TaxID=253628 RepID=A0A0D1XE20_9PEZI|nr:uncharacterized protein PV09_07956 [Verruconis gallopava]KIW00426.1 hypothetical protein PV09_07956 [Verruconis gallopava]